jgi:hypothetical protein
MERLNYRAKQWGSRWFWAPRQLKRLAVGDLLPTALTSAKRYPRLGCSGRAEGGAPGPGSPSHRAPEPPHARKDRQTAQV